VVVGGVLEALAASSRERAECVEPERPYLAGIKAGPLRLV
jgi:hypothetical protein